jgi:hypothetical protein
VPKECQKGAIFKIQRILFDEAQTKVSQLADIDKKGRCPYNSLAPKAALPNREQVFRLVEKRSTI